MYTIQPPSLTTTLTQLALVGSCGYQIQDSRIVINIDEIASQRDFGDISGTLSIEFWALEQPYQGGGFDGTVLAGTQIGELYGQHFLANCRYDLLFQEPPAGTWYLTLMLREWTDAGFMTRDYVNFSLPYVVGSEPTLVRSETDSVINVSFAADEKAAVKSVKQQPATVKAEGPKSEKGRPQAPAATSVPTTPAKPAAGAAKAKLGKLQVSATPAAANKKDKTTADGSVSLNHASLKELAALKGISKKLADHIVSARPFKSLDDLLKVKGVSPKLLRKVRDFVKL